MSNPRESMEYWEPCRDPKEYGNITLVYNREEDVYKGSDDAAYFYDVDHNEWYKWIVETINE